MRLVDSHCHLFLPPLTERLDAVLARARTAGVDRWVVPAYDLDSWQALDGLRGLPGLALAYGLHPWVADQPLALDELAARLQQPGVVAIGEIGLDHAIDGADRSRQLAVCRAQLQLAVDLDRPVLLHCRGAFDELCALLQHFAPRLRGVVHAYSRGPELAGRLVALGMHLGFGGAVTRPRAERARRSARQVPGERLLLETDAPSIGLEGVPAEAVEPHHVAEIARALAALREEPLALLASQTTANAVTLFGLD